MSDDFLDDEFDEQRSEPLDEQAGSEARRRAVWGLGVLACVAIIVGTLMVLLGGSHHHDDNAFPAGPLPTQRPSITGSATSTLPTSTPSSRPDSTSQSPTSAPTTPTSPRTGNPCAAAAACKVDGDGGLVAQLNAYRAKHNLGTVPGKVSEKAQSCALAKGNGSSCSPHWIITVMPDQDGAKAVTKMAGFNEGWLLDRKMSSFEVGWAYTGGSYECVILKAQTTD